MTDKIEFIVNSQKKLLEVCEQVVDFWREHKWITIAVYAKRTLTQNATIRQCYKQIHEDRGDITLKDVERMCKLNYGVPILSRDDKMQGWVFDQTVNKLDYERQLKVMDTFAVTSVMSPSQANEFITQLLLDFPFVVIEKKKNGKYV